MFEFYSDPQNHRLSTSPTPTGLLEFSSKDLETRMPDDPERPPVPHWIEKGEMHDERLTGRKGEKVSLLCVSNHGRWRVHAQCDDVPWDA
jgi:trimethylamine-N-oxide reductase (cytochrome c)